MRSFAINTNNVNSEKNCYVVHALRGLPLPLKKDHLVAAEKTTKMRVGAAEKRPGKRIKSAWAEAAQVLRDVSDELMVCIPAERMSDGTVDKILQECVDQLESAKGFLGERKYTAVRAIVMRSVAMLIRVRSSFLPLCEHVAIDPDPESCEL